MIGVVADGKSDPATFAQQAERLINQEKVDIIIGCWTSASRKSVMPVVERANHLMIYPMAYEGLEISPNIVYTGSSGHPAGPACLALELRYFEGPEVLPDRSRITSGRTR